MRGALFPASLGITATAPLPEQAARAINPQDLAICDNRFVLDWHRLTADHRLTFGSGTSCSGANISGITDTLRPSIEATYPRLIGIAIDYEWFGQDGIIINRTPHLGRISRNLFHAKGYSGHGIATSHIVAEIIGRAITAHMEEFDTFARMRHICLPFGQLAGHQALAAGMWYSTLRERLR